MHELSFSLRGNKDELEWRKMLFDMAARIGMTPAGAPACWRAGTEIGITLVLPLTDSAILVDTWPEHHGAYLRISSCKDFDHGTARDVIEEVGLKVYRANYSMLELP
jgi:S-adenosylmethionine/arginine decarboxylase-like enzyme